MIKLILHLYASQNFASKFSFNNEEMWDIGINFFITRKFLKKSIIDKKCWKMIKKKKKKFR